MFYELWDVESGNIINTYDTEARALEVVRGLLGANPPALAGDLALGWRDEKGDGSLIAEGAALAARARAAAGSGRPAGEA